MTTLVMNMPQERKRQSESIVVPLLRGWRWLLAVIAGVLHVMFVPSPVDRQIEERRNQARRYQMYL